MLPIVRDIEQEYLKQDLPQMHPGDTVKVSVRIKEGNKERIQAYEGVVLKLQGSGTSKTVTVRRVFQGVGIERVFLIHSPKVADIQVTRHGKVRRAKLYYLRTQVGKAARIKEKVFYGAKAKAMAEAAKAAKATKKKSRGKKKAAAAEA